MKLKFKKTNSEMIIDYYRLKDAQELRYSALKYTIDANDEGVIIFVDTNLGVNKANVKDIEDSLVNSGAEYEIKPIAKVERKIFGFSGMFGFGKKKKPQKKENVVVIKMSKDNFSRQMYDSFLKYYDYGIGIGCDLDAHKLTEMYCDEYEEILFNKDVLKKTIYDSILFSRLRLDYVDDAFEDYLRKEDI